MNPNTHTQHPAHADADKHTYKKAHKETNMDTFTDTYTNTHEDACKDTYKDCKDTYKDCMSRPHIYGHRSTHVRIRPTSIVTCVRHQTETGRIRTHLRTHVWTHMRHCNTHAAPD